MKILKNYNLKNLNTFGVSVFAKLFVVIKNENELQELFAEPLFIENDKLFLGGGSNILFTKDFDGIVILNQLKGIKILKEDSENVSIKSMAGEIWNDLVSFTVNKNFWGIENLALIPGTVGAAPMQNIGAYGVELKDVLLNVEAYEIATGEKRIFTKEDCVLGYRDSIFKNLFKNKYFISAISIRLSKVPKPNLSYKILREYLEKSTRNQSSRNKIEIKKSKIISNAVSEIRRSKLPDPKIISNAGSFFKNVFIKKGKLYELLKLYPKMPYFNEPADASAISGKDGTIKISSAWLIEECGWRGKRVGDAGVHDKQALVLVNYGNASGQDIEALAKEIIDSVFDKFKITLEFEVGLI